MYLDPGLFARPHEDPVHVVVSIVNLIQFPISFHVYLVFVFYCLLYEISLVDSVILVILSCFSE